MPDESPTDEPIERAVAALHTHFDRINDPMVEASFDRVAALIEQRVEQLHSEIDTARTEATHWRELAARQKFHIDKRWAELCAAKRHIENLVDEGKADDLMDDLQACNGRWDMTEAIKTWVASGAPRYAVTSTG